jgi:hypothetical protein
MNAGIGSLISADRLVGTGDGCLFVSPWLCRDRSKSIIDKIRSLRQEMDVILSLRGLKKDEMFGDALMEHAQICMAI